MSLLIKGMDMPDSCSHCCMMTGAFCDILNIDVDPYYDGAKHRNVCCPLVELPETCDTCKHSTDVYDSGFCDGCTKSQSNWELMWEGEG